MPSRPGKKAAYLRFETEENPVVGVVALPCLLLGGGVQALMFCLCFFFFCGHSCVVLANFCMFLSYVYDIHKASLA